jgi:hypothetical protein
VPEVGVPSEVLLEAPHSLLRFRRPRADVVVLTVTGKDVGEHGPSPFRELAKDVAAGPFHLFVDARAALGVTIEVSGEWGRWLMRQRSHLLSVHMLTGSRFVQLTAQTVRNFAELGERMRIYTDPTAFEDELAAFTQRAP